MSKIVIAPARADRVRITHARLQLTSPLVAHACSARRPRATASTTKRLHACACEGADEKSWQSRPRHESHREHAPDANVSGTLISGSRMAPAHVHCEAEVCVISRASVNAEYFPPQAAHTVQRAHMRDSAQCLPARASPRAAVPAQHSGHPPRAPPCVPLRPRPRSMLAVRKYVAGEEGNERSFQVFPGQFSECVCVCVFLCFM